MKEELVWLLAGWGGWLPSPQASERVSAVSLIVSKSLTTLKT